MLLWVLLMLENIILVGLLLVVRICFSLLWEMMLKLVLRCVSIFSILRLELVLIVK